MTNKKPTKRRTKKNVVGVESDRDKAADKARTVLRPTVQAALTFNEYGKPFGDLDLTELVDSLTEQTTAVIDGDLGRSEAMLTVQAHTLDSIFNNLAQRAINSKYLDHLDRYLKLALRAQSQCRATWETLAAIKNPPIVYAKQANIAQGHQQVINAPAAEGEASRTGKNKNPPNQLLEKTDGQRLDTRTQATPIRANQEVEAVGE